MTAKDKVSKAEVVEREEIAKVPEDRVAAKEKEGDNNNKKVVVVVVVVVVARVRVVDSSVVSRVFNGLFESFLFPFGSLLVTFHFFLSPCPLSRCGSLFK